MQSLTKAGNFCNRRERRAMTDNANKFWHEKIYNDLLKLAKGLDGHPWSRRQTKRDSHAIAYTVTLLRSIANDLYLARQALREQAQRAEAAMQEAVERARRAEAEENRWREIAEEESWPFEWEIATELRAEKAKLKEQVAELRGLLQGIRTSLERASDLLASPVEVEGAQNFIEGALEAVIEELAAGG